MQKCPRQKPEALLYVLRLLLFFAGLVGDAAAGLAGGLAGSLAFAAAAVLCALAKVLGFERLNVRHFIGLHF